MDERKPLVEVKETVPPVPQSKVATIDAIVDALYESISFPPGGQPDWGLLRSLFLPGGRLIPPKVKTNADSPVLDVEGFIAASGFSQEGGIRPRGFHERDVRRITESFGSIAHVLSTYESRFKADDPEPFERGVNSIQLLRANERWWAVTILWDVEHGDVRIPAKYLSEEDA
jgi:hypothetical protein